MGAVTHSAAAFFSGGAAGTQCPTITVNPATLPNGQLGARYNQQLTQTGGAGTLNWSVSAGALPGNVTLNNTTGLLSGTPTSSGTFNFTARVTDANSCVGERAYSLVINPCPALTLTPTTLPAGTAGLAYNQPLTAMGGTTPYSFNLNASNLPAGLSLLAGGALNGTPASAGAFNFTIRATDANGCTGTQAYALTINAGAVAVLAGLNPSFALTGSSGLTLTLSGANFTNGMIVRWNGADRATSFISSAELRATLPASDLTGNGRASVTAFNQSTGATTAALGFLVVNQMASVSAASYSTDALATESIVAAFGVQLATVTEAAASVPLPLTLGGTSITVRDSTGTERQSPLFYVSPAQVNYQIPPGTASGTALIYASNRDGLLAAQTVQIANLSPGLFTSDASGSGLPAALLYRAQADGTLTIENIARYDPEQNRFVAVPIDFGPATDQLFLVLFGSGLRLRSSLSAVTCTVGGLDASVEYAGSVGGLVGLDQVNLRLPRNLEGRGEVSLLLTVEGKAANAVTVKIK